MKNYKNIISIVTIFFSVLLIIILVNIPNDKDANQSKPIVNQTVSETPILTPQQIESNKHDKWVEEQFKSGTGGRAKLIMMVKSEMNEPSSFKYISNTRSFEGKDLIIIMKFKGKNGFGAVVDGEVKGRVSYEDGSVEIIE